MKRIFLLALLVLTASFVHAQDPYAEYEKLQYKASSGLTLNYRLLRPETIKQGEKYPVVLCLHGLGERGDNNTSQLLHGGAMWLNPYNRENYPAFVIYPQCSKDFFWAYKDIPRTFGKKDFLQAEETEIIKAVLEMLQSYIDLPEADADRVYITGLSMGAMATYDITIRHPEIFAAAIPICGSVLPTRILNSPNIKNVKFRIFHGDADSVVPVEGSRSAYRELKQVGAEVDYIEYPGVDHPSWNVAYGEKDFMEWLFKQKK